MKKLGALATYAILLCGVPQAAIATPPPPAYVELTPAKIKQMGLEYQIWRKGEYSYIELRSPARLPPNLDSHSTGVVTNDLSGKQLLNSTSWANQKPLLVSHRFNHRQVDISISMAYCEPGPSLCVDFGIRSVAAFIKNNAKPGDLE